MSSVLKSQFISSYHSSGKTDQVPDLFYRFNKDYVIVYNRNENNKLISKVTADDLCTIGHHDKESLNITHVSEATFKRKPILILVTTTNTTLPNADKPSIQVFWHRILDQTTSVVLFNSPLAGDVSMVALTSHPLTMVKNSYQEIKEEEHLRHLLVFGKHDQTIQVALIHEADEDDGRVRGLVTKAELPAQDSGVVTAVHILTQDPLDWRLGHNDPRILLGTSNGGIQDMRFHALFREEEPDGGIHIFSPKMLSEFTKLYKEPITYLTCERAPGNRKVIVAVAQQSSSTPNDDNGNPNLHVIEWYGNNRRRVSEVLTPSCLTSYNISSARIILTETDFRVSVIFNSTEEKDRFEVGVWDILDKGAIKLLSEDLVESADNNIIQDMWPNPELSGYTLLYSDSVVELPATPVDVSPQSIPSNADTEHPSPILILDKDDNEISVAQPTSGTEGTLARGIDNSTSAHTDIHATNQVMDKDDGEDEISAIDDTEDTVAHGGPDNSTSAHTDLHATNEVMDKDDSEDETSAMDETEGSLAHDSIELSDSTSTHTDIHATKQTLDEDNGDDETSAMEEEGTLTHGGPDTSVPTDIHATNQIMDKGDEDETSTMDDTEGTLTRGGPDNSTSAHTDIHATNQIMDEDDSEDETSAMDETEGTLAHDGLVVELSDSTSTHTDLHTTKQASDEDDGEDETSAMKEGSLSHAALDNNTGAHTDLHATNQIIDKDDNEDETSVMGETEGTLAHDVVELSDSTSTHTGIHATNQIIDKDDNEDETSAMDETEGTQADDGLVVELSASTHTDIHTTKQAVDDDDDGDEEIVVMEETEISLAYGGLKESNSSNEISSASPNSTQADRLSEDETTGHDSDMEVENDTTLDLGSHGVDTMDNDQPSQSAMDSQELTAAQVGGLSVNETTGHESDMEVENDTALDLGSHDVDTLDKDQPSQSTMDSQELTTAPQKIDNQPDEPPMDIPQQVTTPHTDDDSLKDTIGSIYDESDAFSPKQSDTDDDTNNYEMPDFDDDATDYIPTIDQQDTAESIASTPIVAPDQPSPPPCQEDVEVIPTAKMIYEAKVKDVADISLSDALAMVRNDTTTDFSPRERLWIFFDVLFAASTTSTTTPATTKEPAPCFLDMEKAIATVDELSLDDEEKDWLMGYCYNNVDRPILKLWIMRYNIKHKRYRLVMMQHQTMTNAGQQQHNEQTAVEDRIKRSCDMLAMLCQKMEPEVLQYLPLEVYARPRGKIGNPFLNQEDPTLLKRKGLGFGLEMLQRVLDGKRQRRL